MLFFLSSVLGVFVIFGNVLSIKSHLAHFQVILIFELGVVLLIQVNSLTWIVIVVQVVLLFTSLSMRSADDAQYQFTLLFCIYCFRGQWSLPHVNWSICVDAQPRKTFEQLGGIGPAASYESPMHI